MNTITAATMPAWIQRTYGGVETVSLGETPIPEPRNDEVIVRVRVTALNAADARLMHGDPYLMRLGFGFTKPKCAVRGIDLAGTITAVGSAVTGFEVGDEIVAESAGGALAPYVAVPANRLVKRPNTVNARDAAALPMAGGTAWQALEAAEVTRGQTILVIGASGGVGTFAVQLATVRGAAVWALCGERSRALVEELGAVRTFDYRTHGAESLPKSSFDAIIDIAGSTPLPVLRDLLAPGGTLVMVAGDGGKVLGPIPRMLRAAVLPKRNGRRIRPLMAVAKTDVLHELLDLVGTGRIRSVIEQAYAFEEADAALRHIDSNRTVGKVIVQIGVD